MKTTYTLEFTFDEVHKDLKTEELTEVLKTLNKLINLLTEVDIPYSTSFEKR